MMEESRHKSFIFIDYVSVWLSLTDCHPLADQTSRPDGGQRWPSEHHEANRSGTNGGHGLLAYCLSQLLFLPEVLGLGLLLYSS